MAAAVVAEAAVAAEAAGPSCGMRRHRRICKIHCSTARCSPRCIRRLEPYRRAGLHDSIASALQVIRRRSKTETNARM